MPTLKEALDTISKHCKQTRCVDCPFSVEILSDKSLRYGICNLEVASPENYDEIPIVETNMYDKREVHENCTVEILTNTKTGETSIGWWER